MYVPLFCPTLYTYSGAAWRSCDVKSDDIQLHVHCTTRSSTSEAMRLTACIEQLNNWMIANRLKLNAENAQLIWIGTRQQPDNINTAEVTPKGHRIKTPQSVTRLGVKVDAEVELTFALHVKRVATRWFYQLRQLWTIRQAISADNARILILTPSYPPTSTTATLRCWYTSTPVPVGTERRCAPDRPEKKVRQHQDDLHWLPVPTSRSEYATNSVYLCTNLCTMASSYLCDVCVVCPSVD